MKKKIYLILAMISLLVCFFALNALATTIYQDEEGTELFRFEFNSENIISTYEGEFPREDENGNALTWYVVKSETVNGNTVKTVKSILTLDENYVTLVDGVYTYSTNTVTPINVVSANFPNDMGIEILGLPNAGYRYSNMYSYDPNGSEILFVYLPNTLTVLPERIVQASKALVCHIPFDAPIPRISHVAFHHSKCLREINIPSTLQKIEGKSASDGAAFYQCVSLERVLFGEGSVLKEIQKYAFNGCISLKELSLPDSLLTIGEYTFYGAALVDSPFTRNSQCSQIGKGSFESIKTLKSFIVPNGIVELDMMSFMGWNENIEYVGFGNNPKLRVIKRNCFNGTSLNKGKALSKLIVETLPDTVTTVEDFAFMYTGITDSVFTLNSQCTFIGHMAFAQCTSLKEIIIPRNATFVTDMTSYVVGNQKSGVFYNCKALENVIFCEDSTTSILPTYMFASCSSLTSIKIPNSVTTLSARMFDRCVKLETIILGANVTSLNHGRSWSDSHNSFTYGCLSLKNVYLPKSLDLSVGHSDACHVFTTRDYSGSFSKTTFFVNGDYEEAKAIQDGFKAVTTCNCNDRITNATIISLEEYNSLTEIKNNYIVYNVNTCDAFYGETHVEDNNPCIINCDRCGYAGVAEKSPIHSISTMIEYVRFDLAGVKTLECTNEGCTHATKAEAPALFVCQGYSGSLYGRAGIAIGFLINREAIEDYENATNQRMSYGVFVVSSDALGDGSIFNENAEINQGIINVEIPKRSTPVFELKIVGFENDYRDVKLVMGAFITVTNKESKKIFTLQGEEPGENEKYHSVSYNDIVKSQK